MEIQNTKLSMNRIAVSFTFGRGNFSHFAHFICNFALPLYSLLKNRGLLPPLCENDHLILELKNERKFQIGPLMPLAYEIFPFLHVEYVTQFSISPILLYQNSRWKNNLQDVIDFLKWLTSILPIKPYNYGVIVIQRGIDCKTYLGGSPFFSSGAQRRSIGTGFYELVNKIKVKRPDTVAVTLEQLPLAEQVSLFLNADTLVAQHGAAFVHAHWMKPQGHLIELQCCHALRCPNFVPTIAKLCNHRFSGVNYPCRKIEERVVMDITDFDQVVRLVAPRPSAEQVWPDR
jgi:hypothetical protein